MILEIPALVSGLLPNHFPSGLAHVVCVRTTRAKFLVFASERTRPECVAQFGPGEELVHLHGVLTRLHGMLPDVVPESLVCQPWRGQEFIQVQAGLVGIPWFRLRERFGSSGAWAQLRPRASGALARLHAAVQGCPEWSRRVCPAEELRQQAALCLEHGLRFSAGAHERIAACVEALETLGEVSWFAQHGDYCLNNLLISESAVAIIDFDEFGRTVMPLQDEIGLALSFHHFAPVARRLLPRPEEVEGLLEKSPHGGADLSEWLPGFFLHHLLWRINQAHGVPAREAARQALVLIVEEFAATPGYLAPQAARGHRSDRKAASPQRRRPVVP